MRTLPMASAAFDLDAMPKSLLTVGNPKTAKGEGFGYLTAICHLAPHKLSGANVCGYASAGCAAACLNTAGRGGIGLDASGLNQIQAARIQRTRFFKRDRSAFLTAMAAEIAAHERRAAKHGLRAAVRLNGTSDLPFERFPVEWQGRTFANLMQAFPNVRFYDYTKWPLAKRRPELAPGYHLTFSLAEDNDSRAAEALRAGVNVAAVLLVPKSGDLPATFTIGGETRPVIDGDRHDLRFLDQSGAIVGLRAKGRAKKDASGFTRAA